MQETDNRRDFAIAVLPRVRPQAGRDRCVERVAIRLLFAAAILMICPERVVSAAAQAQSGPAGGQDQQQNNSDLTRDANNRVNIRMAPYGAKADGIADDSKAIQTALADAAGKTLVLPNGTYLVSEDLVVPPDTEVEGQDIYKTVVHVKKPDGFKKGVLVCEGRLSIRLSNVTIEFEQPDGANGMPLTLEQIVRYKPAIYAQNSSSMVLSHVMIARAWDGIDMTGGCGHNYIDDLRLSMFNIGINIDGGRDTIRISRLHCWPWYLSPKQTDLFSLPNQSVGLKVGRCDGLMLDNSLFINGTSLLMYRSSSGTPWIMVSNSDFDTVATIKQTAGTLMASNCGFTSSAQPRPQVSNHEPSVQASDGITRINSSVFIGTVPNVPMIRLTGKGRCSIGDTYFQSDVADRSAIQQDGTESSLQVANSFFNRKWGKTYSSPIIDIRAGGATITGNRVSANPRGSGVFASVAENNFDIISSNVAPDWSVRLPAGATNIQAFGNLVQH